MKYFTGYWVTFAIALATALLGTSELPTAASSRFTQLRPASPKTPETLVAGRLGFRLRVRPSRYRIGGLSGSAFCPKGVTITPVTPPTRPQERAPGEDVAVDTTASAHPTLFIHIPTELPTTIAQLLLQNEAGDQELYSTTLTLTNKPGIVGVRIPNTAQPLEVGQKYLWQISVACDPEAPERLLSTGGWVERVSLDPALASQIQKATLREKIALYAEAGVWQDTVSTLAELRYSNPNDQSLVQDWASLMESVNLKDLARKPIVQIAGN